jgi:hypothetical protein
MKKKIIGGVAILAIAVMAALNMQLVQGDGLAALSLENVEALAGESDIWLSGFVTSTRTLNGVTVPCCVQSASTNACNYSAVSCMYVIVPV